MNMRRRAPAPRCGVPLAKQRRLASSGRVRRLTPWASIICGTVCSSSKATVRESHLARARVGRLLLNSVLVLQRAHKDDLHFLPR